MKGIGLTWLKTLWSRFKILLDLHKDLCGPNFYPGDRPKVRFHHYTDLKYVMGLPTDPTTNSGIEVSWGQRLRNNFHGSGDMLKSAFIQQLRSWSEAAAEQLDPARLPCSGPARRLPCSHVSDAGPWGYLTLPTAAPTVVTLANNFLLVRSRWSISSVNLQDQLSIDAIR